MSKLEEFRRKNPSYSHKSDEELTVAVHRKFYPHKSFDDFAQKFGLRAREEKLEDDLRKSKQKERERADKVDQLSKKLSHAEREEEKLEDDLRKSKQKERERADKVDQLSKKLSHAERELDEKNEEVESILNKIKNADKSESVAINKLKQDLAKAKNDAKLAKQDLKRAEDQSKGDPVLINVIEKLRKKERANEKRMAELDREATNNARKAAEFQKQLEKEKQKVKETGHSPDETPKTWKECAEELGLSGNEFTMTDVKKAFRKRISEVHTDKVNTMDEEIREVAERKSKHVNAAYDYFKKHFKNP